MKRTITVRAAALTAVAALGLSSLGLGAAFAAPEDGNKDIAPASSIDPDAKKSLTIHKFTPSTAAAENDGRELTSEKVTTLTENGSKPIQNVYFKIRKITNLEMTTNRGWQRAEKVAEAFKNGGVKTEGSEEYPAKKLSEEAITSSVLCGKGDGLEACALEPAGTVKSTDANGKIIFGNDGSLEKVASLDTGYYLVEEIMPSANQVPDGKECLKDSAKSCVPTVWIDGVATEASKIVPADPFLVSVPLTNPENKKEWLYNVHVYPKNSSAGVEKEVKDQNTPGAGNSNEGSKITYTIKTEIPAGVKKLQSYVVGDDLDSALEYLAPGNAKNVYLVNEEAAKLTESKEFTVPAGEKPEETQFDTNAALVQGSEGDYTLEQSGQLVLLKFTAKGLRKLVTARDTEGVKAVKVVWELDANIKDGGARVIPNEARLQPPNETFNEWDPKKGTPSKKTTSKYGKVTITKKGSGDDAEKLNKAVFQLFLCNADGQILNYKDDAHPAQEKKKAGETNEQFLERVKEYKISVKGKNEWVSGVDGIDTDDGKIVIDGLQLNDWENDLSQNGKPGTVENPDWYCLVETQAPDGYELLPNPIKFQLLQENNTAEDGQAPVYEVAFPVKNVKKNGGFELPVTGGQGIALLVTAGGLLVAGSVIYTVAAARKRKQQA